MFSGMVIKLIRTRPIDQNHILMYRTVGNNTNNSAVQRIQLPLFRWKNAFAVNSCLNEAMSCRMLHNTTCSLIRQTSCGCSIINISSSSRIAIIMIIGYSTDVQKQTAVTTDFSQYNCSSPATQIQTEAITVYISSKPLLLTALVM